MAAVGECDQPELSTMLQLMAEMPWDLKMAATQHMNHQFKDWKENNIGQEGENEDENVEYLVITEEAPVAEEVTEELTQVKYNNDEATILVESVPAPINENEVVEITSDMDNLREGEEIKTVYAGTLENDNNTVEVYCLVEDPIEPSLSNESSSDLLPQSDEPVIENMQNVSVTPNGSVTPNVNITQPDLTEPALLPSRTWDNFVQQDQSSSVDDTSMELSNLDQALKLENKCKIGIKTMESYQLLPTESVEKVKDVFSGANREDFEREILRKGGTLPVKPRTRDVSKHDKTKDVAEKCVLKLPLEPPLPLMKVGRPHKKQLENKTTVRRKGRRKNVKKDDSKKVAAVKEEIETPVGDTSIDGIKTDISLSEGRTKRRASKAVRNYNDLLKGQFNEVHSERISSESVEKTNVCGNNSIGKKYENTSKSDRPVRTKTKQEKQTTCIADELSLDNNTVDENISCITTDVNLDKFCRSGRSKQKNKTKDSVTEKVNTQERDLDYACSDAKVDLSKSSRPVRSKRRKQHEPEKPAMVDDCISNKNNKLEQKKKKKKENAPVTKTEDLPQSDIVEGTCEKSITIEELFSAIGDTSTSKDEAIKDKVTVKLERVVDGIEESEEYPELKEEDGFSPMEGSQNEIILDPTVKDLEQFVTRTAREEIPELQDIMSKKGRGRPAGVQNQSTDGMSSKMCTCDICGVSMANRSHLKIHRRRHTGERPFVCELCGRAFRQKGALQHHLKVHKGIKDYACMLCEYKACSKSQVLTHVRKSHTNEKPFSCDVCGVSFHSKKSLWGHQIVHKELEFNCQLCDFKTARKHTLTTHMHNLHGNQEPTLNCPLCNFKFKHKISLNVHMRKHTGERPYSCHVCNANFTSQSQRSQHLKIHQEKTFACTDCKKMFVTKHQRDRHMAVHTGEKSHACPFCTYRCNIDSNLRKHCKSVHREVYPPIVRHFERTIGKAKQTKRTVSKPSSRRKPDVIEQQQNVGKVHDVRSYHRLIAPQPPVEPHFENITLSETNVTQLKAAVKQECEPAVQKFIITEEGMLAQDAGVVQQVVVEGDSAQEGEYVQYIQVVDEQDGTGVVQTLHGQEAQKFLDMVYSNSTES